MKVTTKIAKNDARLYYVDSKRVSRDKALETAAQNRVGNPFVIEYDTEQNHYFVQGGIEKHVYTDRRTFETLKLRIDSYHGFTVYCGTCNLRWFACNVGAKNFAAQIEDAFINGEHGIKITVDGTISILPAEVSEDNNVGNLTDSALAASNSRLAAFRTNDAVTEIDVSEYAITEDAFNFAVEQEIEDAEQAAFEARVTARILADDNLAALYEKAKSQVKCERYENGWRSWYFKGKNRTEWELNATKAAACLTRYGLSRWQFAILHDAEVAVIESNGIDETAFDFLPNFEDDELRDYLYDFDERQQLLEDKYEPKTTANTVTEENKIYTLTVYATEDFKGLYGGNTLVKNFDTCWKLYDSGKHVIFTNSWKLERAGKTIATGNGIKDFCRFITCEFDVSERLAEIVDARSVDMEICGEHVYFQNGKFMWVILTKKKKHL